jgi:hypothetical protein
MVQGICFIEVDNVAEILPQIDQRETDYFESLTKTQNENSRNFEHQRRRYPSQLSNEYLCVSCR